jgi:hypothetical protein
MSITDRNRFASPWDSWKVPGTNLDLSSIMYDELMDDDFYLTDGTFKNAPR